MNTPTAPTTCTWEYQPDEDAWATECGELFIILEGTPAENKMRFCCYCGRPIGGGQLTLNHPLPSPGQPIPDLGFFLWRVESLTQNPHHGILTPLAGIVTGTAGHKI